MAGKPDSWMPLYVSDWDADTAHLSCEEDGAYGRLIRFYWRNGPPADSDAVLARIVREPVPTWRRIRPALVPFFIIDGGKWTHRRVDAELTEVRERYERRSSANRANVQKRKDRSTNGSTNGSPFVDGSNTQPQPHSPTFGGEEDSARDEAGAEVIAFRREVGS